MEDTMNQTERDERAGLPSASAAPRWMNCTASMAREAVERALEPEPEQSDAAAFGSRIHAALEGALPSSELSTAELQTFERIKPLWHQLVERIGFEHGKILLAEKRLWLHDEAMEPVMSGRLDLALAANDAVAIIEYKTLKAPEPACNNWQLRAQAVLLAEEHPEFAGDGTTWHLAIIQPNASPQISHAEFSSADVMRWRASILDSLAHRQSASAPAMPGCWCEYCRARATCREHAAFTAVALADTVFPELAEIIKNKPAFVENALQTWSQLTPQQRVARYSVVKLAADLEAEIAKRMKSELEQNSDAYSGMAILKPGPEVRKIQDVRAAVEALARDGVTVEHLLNAGAINIAVGKAEVAYANAKQAAAGEKITKGCPQKYAEQFNAALGDAIVTEKRAPSLVLNLEQKPKQIENNQ